MAARVVGAQPSSPSTPSDRLALAIELGANHVLDARHGNTVDEVRKITGEGVHYALEAIRTSVGGAPSG